MILKEIKVGCLVNDRIADGIVVSIIDLENSWSTAYVKYHTPLNECISGQTAWVQDLRHKSHCNNHEENN